MKIETVEEFLARGGKITNNITPHRIENDYSDKEFEKELHSFYQSSEWKSLRSSVKKELTNMCPVCGSEDNLVVDHIKPVRRFWEERLNIDNLQILCDDCNIEKGSMINWTLEWHLKNKKFLSENRERIDLSIKIEEQRKNKAKDELSAFADLELYERMELNSCFNSYLSRCKKSKILPVTKTKFRYYIENNMSKNINKPWFFSSEIKRFIKNNFKKIQ